jgi:hypothetical protein
MESIITLLLVIICVVTIFGFVDVLRNLVKANTLLEEILDQLKQR